MLRRRLALLLVAAGLLANASLDYRLFLRNPEELEAQARKVLRQVLPGYAPSFGSSEFSFATQRLVLRDVVFHEKGDPARPLLAVERLEVQATGFPPREFLVLLVRPQITLRIDEEGRLNLPGGGGGGGGLPDALPAAIAVALQEGRVLVDFDYQGLGQWVAIDDVTIPVDAPLRIARDLEVIGGGSLRLGSLLAPDHRLFVGSEDLTGLPAELDERRFRPLVRRLEFTVSRAEGHPLRVEAAGAVTLTSLIGELLPDPFDVIWTELRPREGQVDVRARVQHDATHGLHVSLTLEPDRAGIQPAGFPVPITDVGGGRFEVAVGVPPGGEPEFIGVHWEGITGFVGERRPGRDLDHPQLTSRGSVYPGRDDEGISMLLYADVRDLPLSTELTRAFPPDILEVYRQFDPQGSIPRAYVTIFKGPFTHDVLVLEGGAELPGRVLEEGPAAIRFHDAFGRDRTIPRAQIASIQRNDEPQLSIVVPEIGGAISGTYRGEAPDGSEGVDVRLLGARGAFRLREGANVTLQLEGELDVGGVATVRAQVMQGDLISVDVRGAGVPMSERVVAALPDGTREVAEAFHLQGGTFDFGVRVEKSAFDHPAQPTVTLDLHNVSFQHDAFRLPLTAQRGRVEVLPVFETREQESPSRIEVQLRDLLLAGEGVVAAAVSGSLTLPPEQPPDRLAFSADLDVRVEEFDLGQLPPRGRRLLETIGPPTGTALGVVAHVRGPRTFHVTGAGRDLVAVPEHLPHPLEVERFDVELTGEAVVLHDVRAHPPAGGALTISGRVALPPAGAEAAPEERDVTLRVAAEALPVGPELIAALPPAARGPLQRLQLSGPVSGLLDLRLAPGARPRVTGELTLAGVEAHLDRLVADAVVRRDGTRLEGVLLGRDAEAVELRDAEGALHRVPLDAVAAAQRNPLSTLAGAPVRALEGRVRLLPDRVELVDLQGTFQGAPARASGRVNLDDAGLELTASLLRFPIDARARELAGPLAAPFFRSFDASGPADLTFLIRRGPSDETTAVDLVAEPRGMTVIPALAPVPLTDVRGRVVLRGGDPVEITLDAALLPPDVTLEPRLEGPTPRLRVERRADAEGRFPGDGRDGRVYYVRVTDLRRFDDRKKREAFEGALPKGWRAVLDAMQPEGSLDIESYVYVPHEERQSTRWVAEVALREFAFTAGAMRFERVKGRAWAQGRLSEFELGWSDGSLELERLDWKEQTFTQLHGPFSVDGGVLRLGRLGAPFLADLYGGEFRGIVEYAFKTGRYGGWLSLGGGPNIRDGELAVAMRELEERSAGAQEVERKEAQLGRWRRELAYLQEEARPQDATRIEYLRRELPALEQEITRLGRQLRTGSTLPYRGKLFARLDFNGGGPDLMGRPQPFQGEGVLTLTRSNLLDAPALRALHTVLTPFVGSSDSTDALPNLELRFDATPEGLRLEDLRLWGPNLTVRGQDGFLRTDDGYIDIPLVVFDVQGAGHRWLRWVPGTGWRYRGFLSEGPAVTTLPGLATLEEGVDSFRDLLLPDRSKDE